MAEGVVMNEQKVVSAAPGHSRMARVTIVHPAETIQVPSAQVMSKCALFRHNPGLADSAYRLRSSVPLSAFQQFASALEGNAINATPADFPGLSQLSEEFGFDDLTLKFSEIRHIENAGSADWSARSRIAVLEEWANLRDLELAELRHRLSREAALRESATAETARKLSTEVSKLRALIPPGVASSKPSPEIARVSTPPLPSIDSVIVLTLPEILAEFRGKHFKLLWRGTRDGFSASDFHSRCDGHPNTVTLVLDTAGNIFGGFTPVAWRLDGHSIPDESVRSFLFTLKNPHGLPAKKFPLKQECKSRAIWCSSVWGPAFYDDLAIVARCNERTESYTRDFGSTFTNDTGLPGGSFFTGSTHFQVKEIEILEITS
jgi:hypothetical protein